MSPIDQILDPITMLEVSYSTRLLVAALLGMAMGLERSVSGKHAGMRTYAMVSLGSALFVIIGMLASYELSIFSGINPLAIASSVVIGIGFIGSGLAAFKGEHIEVTTASGLWVVAAVGMAAGFGLYVLAISGAVISLLVFSVFSRFERIIRVRYGSEVK
ncbi:MgtC/SapB family protein [Patescibacteria group bacterium]|nr:MgtC/SapB family protein [Patescibacteria group bacterium]